MKILLSNIILEHSLIFASLSLKIGLESNLLWVKEKAS